MKAGRQNRKQSLW